MIFFKNLSATSTTMVVLTLTVIILCFVISSFLNPIVFFYNKKKTSIAGLLFCIVSATDFTVCFFWLGMVLYYAATVDLKEMGCDLEQPQICNSSKVSSVNLATGLIGVTLNSLILITTAALTIVRAIQIKFPFYQLKKSLVLVILFSVAAVQAALWSFLILSPQGDKWFRAVNYMSLSSTPLGVTNYLNPFLPYISAIPILASQSLSLVASMITGVTLFRQQKCNPRSSRVKSRRSGALKVLLTNVPSLTYAVIFCTPLLILISGSVKGKESDGWAIFWTSNVLPPLSSVWNPIVFVSLTPKSREHIRSLLVLFRQNPTNVVVERPAASVFTSV